jgi:hypothetical protein
VVAGGGVGVRRVAGDDLLAGPACSESFRMGPLALQRPYGKCSWSGASAHDGSVVGSHAMTHGDAEFELRWIRTRSRRVGCRAKFRRILRRDCP